MKIAVIGGGINGFSCAVQILEYLKESQQYVPYEITVISEEFSPNTTGDGSAGLWGPYLLGGTSINKVHKWSKSMHKFLEKIWLSEDAAEAGVCLIPVVRLTNEGDRLDDFWKDIVYGCLPLTSKQLDEYSERRSKKYTAGLEFMTYTSEPLKLLPYLMKRYTSNGGKIIKKKIDDLEGFIQNNPYDVIVNCTGLGSQQIIKDKSMFPVRGQVSRVKANWMYFVLLDESDDGIYIIPNMDSVVLGGTHQKNDYNTKVSTSDQNCMLTGCQQAVPALMNAQHLYDWVGLRPGRDELRLEVDSKDNDAKIIIHNYGHGGSGVTLAWGCAEDVLELLKTELQHRQTTKSKL